MQRQQEVQRRIGKARRASTLRLQSGDREEETATLQPGDRAKIMYGLETCRIMDRAKKNLAAFQVQGLRAICGLYQFYYDRSRAKEIVRDIAQHRTD